MIPAALMSEQLFVLGVTVVAVLPRLPSDKSMCSVGGGNVGHPFRRLLLALAGINLLHCLASINDSSSRWIFIAGALDALGIVVHNFLCLLTPYLLQKWLAGCINVRPGRDLTPWLWIVSVLGVAGAWLSRTADLRFSALMEIAHAASCVPVATTLRTYSRVTTPAHGRGTVMAQMMLLTECWHGLSQAACAAGYAFGGNLSRGDSALMAELVHALHEGDFMTDWSRVLMHAVFINQLDELSYVRVRSEDGGAEEGEGGMWDDNGVPCTRTELVALGKK